MAVPNDPPSSPGKWSRKPSHDCASAIAATRRRFCTHQARPPGIPFATITSPPPGFAKVSQTCVRAHTPPEPPRSRTADRPRTPPTGSSASRHIRPQDRKQASCSRTSASAARTPHALRATAPAGSSNRKAPALTPWHQLTPVRGNDLNRPRTVNDRSACAAQARHWIGPRHATGACRIVEVDMRIDDCGPHRTTQNRQPPSLAAPHAALVMGISS